MASRLLRASLRAIARPSIVRPVAASVRPAPVSFIAARSFSAATVRMTGGSVDADLAHKLEEEIQYEKSSEDMEQPEFVQEFLTSSSFKLEDRPRCDEVTLTRYFGNEKIQVLFSISDINNAASDDLLDEDDLADDTETNVAAPGEEDIIEESFPVRASVTICKDDKVDPSGKLGALTFDMLAQDGELSIESVMFFQNAKLASEQTADADWVRRGLYIGPQFGELDEGLQSMFQRYLEERGLNSAVAQFLPDYVEHKEQKEYTQWLQDVKNFVSA